MKYKSCLFFVLIAMFSVQMTFAQEILVKGKVTGVNDLPLIGVTVVVKDSQKGTQTDFNGDYQMMVEQGATLVFSYLGFKTAYYKVKGTDPINMVMEKETAQLAEVVILGYVSKTKDEFTGAATQLSGDEVSKGTSVTVVKALQGKVAGVAISSISGVPGSMQDIRIRGISSLTASNSALFVINGVPVLNDNVSFSDERSTLGPLSALNSDDIQSVTVLKDAAATALYGARGANGVIVITTKDGEKGEVSISLSTGIGIKNDAYNKRKVLTGTQKLMLLKESLVNSFGESDGVTMDNAIDFGVNNALLPPSILGYDGSNYDWSGSMVNRDAFLQNYTLSASGGSENGSFYTSLAYNKTEATVVKGEFERLVGTFNMDKKLSDNANLGINFNISNVKQNPLLEADAFFANPFTARYLMNPFNAIYNKDGELNTDLSYGPLPNILYVLENDYNRNMLTRGLLNAKFDWNIFNNLTFSNNIGMDYQFSEYKSYQNPVEGDGATFNGASEKNNHRNFNYVYQGSLKYELGFGEGHHLGVTGLFEYQKNESSSLYGYGVNFPTKGLINISTASADFQAASSYYDWYNISYLGLLSYDFKGRYVIDFTYRREGSSKFAEGKRFGNFGAIGLAWNMHNEKFVPEVFSKLRFRASAGITGNSGIGINLYQSLLGYSGAYDETGAGEAIQFGNPNLTWEKNEVFDIGFDFGLWDNRFLGSLSYYSRRTYDLLYAVPLSYTTGFNSQIKNVGEMTNKGFEISLDLDVIRTRNFLWNISGNFATVKNEITQLPLGTDGEPIDRFSSSVYKTDRVGLPTGTWYMPTWAGVNSVTGSPMWYINGRDGAVTSAYYQAERVTHGSALPTMTGGLSTRIEFKGFFASASVYYAGGHNIYEQFSQFYLRTGSFTLRNYNGVQELLQRWQKPGDITDVPKLDFTSSNDFHRASTRHLYEGDYVRLKHVSFGYSLPSDFANSLGLDDLTITLRGNNVMTWVKDGGLKLDPEVRISGYTELSTPVTQSYTLGVDLKF